MRPSDAAAELAPTDPRSSRTMRRSSIPFILATLLARATNAQAQEPGPSPDPLPGPGRSLDLGIARYGVSFGNSSRWTGVRINWSDRDVQRVDGLNLTLWRPDGKDRKSTRLNSSHVKISYAVFCLKKKYLD